ncbi:chromosome segregation protein Csm1/Pcs1-domain-containing protein [Tricharina praecox]|uniref:chromosome segregation protein Csm1/Pcs1-domain-containing protein n=1 Tax=Tricharina praecox TaxID=43433 RepID=UPI00222019CD|nr:chromosome segregation protein Csm1/Pcs1-domain-containing protein [Tricharina praecox]KAI5854156.1 chromosome segregation protein Csm1/Pcs1-domain-containing protein [Tricharina praecox]
MEEGEEDELTAAQAPAVKTNGKASANGKKRGAPAAAAPPAKKGRKAAALPVDVVEVVAAKAKGRGRKAAPAAAAVEAEEEEEEVKEVAVAKSKRGKKEVVEVEIAETQDVYMHDVCVESVPAARKMGALVDRRKELLRLEEMRKIEAEERLEEFVRNSEAIQTDAGKVIAALQADLAAQTALAAESRSLTKKLAAKDAENAKLSVKIAELSKTVATAQKDNQVLQAKLTAAESSRTQVPGSAMKPGRGGVVAMAMAGIAGDHAWKSQVKEELYQDLTNLVIMTIKKDAETHVFECLQTGTNGTLHFRLNVRAPNTARKSKPPGTGEDSDDKDDEDYVFMPILNEQRDEFVISLLPDYLRQEISFSRDHAARFFQKIHTILMKPPIIEDDDETEEDDEGSGEEGDDTMATAIEDTTIPDGE